MAFDLYAAQGYGFGTQDVTNPTDPINSYAKVTAINTTAITVDDSSAFNVGTEILLHDTSPGRWLIAFVSDKTGNVLTLNKDVSNVWASLPNYLQAVTIPHYKTLTIQKNNSISPPAFQNGKGGILVFKCNESFTLNGSINLVDKGISTATADIPIRILGERHWEATDARFDTDIYSGYENATMPYYVPLNSGDGMAFIISKRFNADTAARIGNPATKGRAYFRAGVADDYVTNVGGSTILLVAESLNSFVHVFAKYRDPSKPLGEGLARCYVASDTVLPNDEALYSYDIISDPTRLKANCNIGGFGNGSFGSKTNPEKDINVFAQVLSIDDKKIEYANKSASFSWPSQALVLIHFKNKSTSVTNDSGRFYLAHVLSDDGNRFTLSASPPFTVDLDNYSAQIIRVPQYKDFTLNQTYNYTKTYDGKTGGIFAIAVKGTCDLRGAVIDMQGKGGNFSAAQPVASPYNFDNKPMTFGNVYNHSRLPIGEGHGSIFILAKTLKLDGDTRLGATYTGNAFGGANRDSLSGGWKGVGDELAGSGKGGGHVNDFADGYGGYGCNAYHYDSGKRLLYAQQGAHLFIVADTIDGLSLANISTGGEASSSLFGCQPGGAGYGGGSGSNTHAGGSGGYLGGGVESNGFLGGGGAGAAFIYANNVVNQSTGNIV